MLGLGLVAAAQPHTRCAALCAAACCLRAQFASGNVVAEANLFESLGVGLGRHEMYGISLAIKQLGEDPKRGIKSIRFFGKLLGLYNDYYVYEVQHKAAGEVPDAPEGEVPFEKGAGTNKYTYLVSTSVGGPVEQLPFATPAHVKASRQIRKYLTGRLASHVSTYPLFPGTEAHYLRALIARIASATVLCPNGALSPNEENGGELEPTEGFEMPPGNEMAQAANWVHM